MGLRCQLLTVTLILTRLGNTLSWICPQTLVREPYRSTLISPLSKEIGQWLIKSGLALWKKGKPPKFEVAVAGRAHFRLKAVYSR
jgi:hypothetical protein